MRVLQVSNKPKFGGIGIYVDGLTEELARQGVEVGWFYAGEYDLGFRPRVCRSESAAGVKIFALKNSPNLHAAYRITHPSAEISERLIEKAFAEVLDAYRPQLVHFHDLGGLCSSLISIAARRSVVTVTTLNCYWFICPKNDLISNVTGAICAGPQCGVNCAKCVPYAGQGTKLTKVQMLGWRLLKSSFPDRIFRWVSKPLLKYQQRARQVGERCGTRVSDERPDLVDAYRRREIENLRLLSDTVTLNIAVTSFVKQRFIEWGVPAKKLVVQHFGTRAAEFLTPTERQAKNPITFGYIGPLAYHKGAHVLIDAFKRLKVGSANLIVYGNSDSDYGKSIMASAKGALIDFRGAYRHSDLQRILDEIDVIVVPPIWYDNSPQVVFEAYSAGVPVIGSKIGGIPDFVENEVNGLLFPAGDVVELSACMARLVEAPRLLDGMRHNIKPMKTMFHHVIELAAIYNELT
jgi:glycosyltransferase involved in cell wall biosynthesis